MSQLWSGSPLMAMQSVAEPWMWVAFLGFVIVLLTLDLLVFRRAAHEVSFKEALGWSIFWIGLALAFNVGIYFYFGLQDGPRLAAEFLQGYLLEKALSVDNLFVFLVIFAYFKVPPAYQRRVLFWGILGALIMRAIFILAGYTLLSLFHPVIYVFAAFLIFTGLKMLFSGEDEADPGQNIAVKLFRKLVRSVDEYDGEKFFTVRNGVRYATPLMLVLVTVEFTDVIFALDSIPAVFGVTNEPFIVYTSNIFAILGLRALFFLLAGMMGRFHYLKLALALVLVFIGVKMTLKELKIYEISTTVSLCVIAGMIALSVVASLLSPKEDAAEHVPVPELEKDPDGGNKPS